MNKRCTDSSCRRTFSTLDFDGRCPYCGKAYPQLNRQRKKDIALAFHACGDPVPASLPRGLYRVLVKPQRINEKIEAIKAIRHAVPGLSLKGSKDLIDGVITGIPFTVRNLGADQMKTLLQAPMDVCFGRQGKQGQWAPTVNSAAGASRRRSGRRNRTAASPHGA